VSRSKPSSILVATLLAAATLSAARGQDATRPGTQSANQSSSAVTPGVSSQGPAAGPAPPSAGASEATPSAPSGSPADKPPPVCFKLTGRCVDAGSSQAGSSRKSPTPTRTDPHRKGNLNLSAPDVRTVIPPDQLKEPLPTSEQITEVQESETVSVKGESEAPDVPGGFGAIWWALNHPSQAWRILTPVE
jgi:hypothetical protein